MIKKTLLINKTQIHYIYLENGLYKMTNKDNFNARIQNAREIMTLHGFTNVNDIIEYLNQWYEMEVL